MYKFSHPIDTHQIIHHLIMNSILKMFIIMWYKNLLSIIFLHVFIYQIILINQINNEILLTINDLELTYHY